ncbi:hypothetical protein HPB49_008406 [Dermacentor silvarum]|uniref:Uncharacterized protein n=1 Tax=Dermacentor silvarum TaxID=543639 RepID=A0ACB8DXR3_DERSI|nr:hypothetical protein HPB49_008406 [Dermacentor silvarum]
MADMADAEGSSSADRRHPASAEVITLRHPRDGRPYNIPPECTQTPTEPCEMLAQLPVLNDFLVSIGVQAVEVAFRKIRISDNPTRLRGAHFTAAQVSDGTLALFVMICRHRCVDAMHLKVLPQLPQSPTIEPSFWAFVGRKSWITRLVLVGCVPRRACVPSLIAAITDLLERHLVQLTLIDTFLEGVTESNLDRLKKTMAESRTLTTLDISHVGHCTNSQGLTEPDVLIDQAVIDGVSDNPTVTNLTFAFGYPRDACQASIKRLLANTTSLTSLTITHWALHDRAFSVKNIIGALSANRTLTSLTLKHLNLSPLDKENLAEFLNSNRTLQYAAFLTHRTSLEGACTSQVPRPHVDALVKALKKNTSLEQLFLNWTFSLQEIRHLAQALHGKVLRVHLPAISLDNTEHFLRMFQGVPGSRNIMFSKCRLPEGSFLPMISTRDVPAHRPHCSSTIYDIDVNNLSQLLTSDCGDCVRRLELRHCQNFCVEDRKQLESYLTSTRRLEFFVIEIPNDPELLTAVFNGVSQNSSIEYLTIYVHGNIDDKSVELFSGWLSRNERLYQLQMQSYRGMPRVSQQLAHSVKGNYALMFTALRAADGSYYEHLDNLTRRNQGLLYCAAGFVLGCTQRRAAKAYGLLALHPLLREAVLHSRMLSNRELRARIATAENFRRREFWRQAGIVSGELVCNEPQCDGDSQLPEAPLQLDELGPYILAHICSFLTLADVSYEHEELRGWPGRLED